jgi:hypothetical protein
VAAILPFYADWEEMEQPEHDLERADMAVATPDEPVEFDEVILKGTFGQLGGLGDTASSLDPLSQEGLNNLALDTSHSGLMRQAWTRQVIAEELAGATYTLGIKEGKVHIQTDKPVRGAEWELRAGQSLKPVGTSLLTKTSKMACPSYSLPAGPQVSGGTCPGANGGQSVMRPDGLRDGAAKVMRVTGKPVFLSDAICQHCYATGNTRYGRTSMILKQTLVYAWTQSALADGSFVEVMTYAVDTSGDYLPERDGNRYFRIHDSGDFFSPDYLFAWKQVCNNLPDITFWAPSRVWATDWGIEAVREANSDYDDDPRVNQSNLIIRPSNYHLNEQPPEALREPGSGWASWSTAWHKKRKPKGKKLTLGKPVQLPQVRVTYTKSGKTSLKVIGQETGPAPYDWDCQAYLAAGRTCRTATAPDGKQGCRACWKRPELVVNYTEH